MHQHEEGDQPVESPSFDDVPLDDNDGSGQSRDSTNNQQQLAQLQSDSQASFEIDYDSCCDEPENAVCASGGTICMLLTILIIFLSGLAVGFALFPRTRRWSLVIVLPLIIVAILSCVTVMCFISCRASAVAVIEPCDLPEPLPRNKKKEDSSEVADTAASTLTEAPSERESMFASTFPELAELVSKTQKSFDESREFIVSKIIRPATAVCRPTPPTRCHSTDVASVIKTEPDVECCVDVHCLRDENGVVNLSGTYKLVHNNNFDGFLKALQIPSLLRRAANASRPVHTYTHEGDSFRVQIDGIIKGDTQFTVNGEPTVSSMRSHKFLDHVSYNEDKSGIIVRKVGQNTPKNSSASEIIVTRELSKNGKKMFLKSAAVDADGVIVSESIQTFLRI